jgi:predicted dehydrogenase
MDVTRVPDTIRVNRLLVAGGGSAGLRHLENVLQLGAAREVVLWHQKPSVHDHELRRAGVEVIYSLDDVLARPPTAAIIATPATSHIEIATALALTGAHLLIEKPIADRLSGVQKLIDLCANQGVVLLVGYTLRFASSLRFFAAQLRDPFIGRAEYVRAEVGQFLPDWRPGRAFRSTVTARRETGGGALMELSHEINYVQSWFGEISEVKAWVGNIGSLGLDVEDSVEAIFKFHDGPLASIHLDLLSRSHVRRCRVDGAHGSLEWDGIAHNVYRLHPERGRELVHAGSATALSQAYVSELRHFFECIAGQANPIVTGEDALKTLQTLVRIRDEASHVDPGPGP